MSEERKLRSFKRLKGIIVLSLFDGMSCGQIALERVGIKVDTYYASEIDPYAIQVTKHNYPNTIHIGSVLDITIKRLDKFEVLLNGEYIIDTRKLILIGGSPCQGFSFAGKQKGSSTKCNIDVTTLEQYLELKSQSFEFEGQSYLFWEYMRVLHAIKPMYYFLENVMMTDKWKGMFNDAVGHEPIIINSALVSAQSRLRLYWTDIPNVTQPEDKGIFIKDIIGNDAITYKDKLYCITMAKHRGGVRDFFLKSQSNILFYKSNDGNLTVKDNFVYFKLPKSKNPDKLHKIKCKLEDGIYSFRRLTINETEKGQTVPVGYTSVVNDTNACDMLGNGWTIDVVSHFFKELTDV